jgi:hypothetical protein
MLRKFLCASVVLVLVGTIALAETLRGTITKVTDDEVTITVRAGKGKKGKGKEQTFKINAGAKVLKVKGKDDTEDSKLSDLKKAVEDGGKRGVTATIEVNDDKKVTEIKYGGGRRKKKTDTE